jgi:hypothetical protein
VVYISDRICGPMCDRVGPTRGLWRILDGKVECGLMSDSELRSGSPHLCQLRTDRLAPGNKIDYVLTHTRFMGSRKLSSFDGHQVGRYVTSLHGYIMG